jgi:hypothetical protein
MAIRTTMIIAIILSTAASSSHAQMHGFDAASQVTLSTLSATISHSTLNYLPVQTVAVEGNRVHNIMNNSTGIMSITQNSGSMSNVQQAITVRIGQLVLPAQP